MIIRFFSALLIGFVKFYQGAISPLLGNHCRHTPTCSQYSIEAIKEWGPFKGIWLGLKRFSRCHPWGTHGYDPIPKKKIVTMMDKIIAIDFDGVLHRYSKGWNGGIIYDKPVEGSKKALESLKKQGFTIYIYTGRTNSQFRHQGEKDQLLAIEKWLKKYEIPFDKVWLDGKPAAKIYLDDRAVRFNGNWKDILLILNDSDPWWKKLKDN